MKILNRKLLFLLMLILSNGVYGQNRAPLNLDEGMERLAEILGSLHYLDDLCNDNGGAWRGFMDKILLEEVPTSSNRARLIAAFNRSYRAFSENYYQCTPAAETATNLYHQEGKTLVELLVNRYGN